MANSNNCACTDKENVCSLKVSRNKALSDLLFYMPVYSVDCESDDMTRITPENFDKFAGGKNNVK